MKKMSTIITQTNKLQTLQLLGSLDRRPFAIFEIYLSWKYFSGKI